jgi:hypothetical protein
MKRPAVVMAARLVGGDRRDGWAGAVVGRLPRIGKAYAGLGEIVGGTPEVHPLAGDPDHQLAGSVLPSTDFRLAALGCFTDDSLQILWGIILRDRNGAAEGSEKTVSRDRVVAQCPE